MTPSDKNEVSQVTGKRELLPNWKYGLERKWMDI